MEYIYVSGLVKEKKNINVTNLNFYINNSGKKSDKETLDILKKTIHKKIQEELVKEGNIFK